MERRSLKIQSVSIFYFIFVLGTVHAKMITRFYIYNVIKFPYV